MRRTSIAALFALSAMVWGCSSNSKCKTDHDCNAAKRCVVSTGKCEPLTCSSDSACPVGYTCTNNFCFEQDLLLAEQPAGCYAHVRAGFHKSVGLDYRIGFLGIDDTEDMVHPGFFAHGVYIGGKY